MRLDASLVLLALFGAPAEAPPREAAVAAPATLTVANREIVTFRATVMKVGPAERVRAASERIDALPPLAYDEPVTTHAVSFEDERGVAVLVGGRIAFHVVDGDVDPDAALGREKVAAEAAGRLKEALGAWHEQRSVRTLIRGVILSAAATAALLGLLWLLARARRVAERALLELATRLGAALSRGKVDVGPVVTSVTHGIIVVAYWGLVVVALDVWLTFVLGRFPLTAPWADVLTSRALGILASVGLAGLRSIPDLATVAAILLFGRLVAGFLSGVFDRAARGALSLPGVYPETVAATRKIVLALVWLVALAASYPYIPGSSSEAFKGLSLLVGVMISLGSTGLVSQAMSGLALVYSRALTEGDVVRVAEVEGVVTEVGLLATKILAYAGEEVTVPNSVLLAGSVRNFTRLARGEGPLVTTKVTIGYDAPWRQVHGLLLAAAEGTAGIRREPAPIVLQRALSDFYAEYELRARLEGEPTERPRVLSDLHQRIQDVFNEAGVQIMSPHFMMQPERPVVVPPERWEGEREGPPRERRSGP
jgi:small-conductance mechanosensitive channel